MATRFGGRSYREVMRTKIAILACGAVCLLIFALVGIALLL